MEIEIVNLLSSMDYDTLCSKYNLYNFQTQMLSFMYLNTKSYALKAKIVEGIQNGLYSSEENVKSMFKTFIDKAIKSSRDNGLSILIEKCRLSEIDAKAFISNYLKANKSLDEMLSAELEVSNTNIRMSEMIEEIMPAFLESEKNKLL